MPFASKAQQRKLELLASQGKFPKDKLEEWEAATKAQPGGFQSLPERVKPQPRKSAQRFAQLAKSVTSRQKRPPRP